MPAFSAELLPGWDFVDPAQAETVRQSFPAP
jgi:hypothetical protein